MILAQAPFLILPPAFIPLTTLHITSSQSGLNLYTWAAANGYPGSGNCALYIDSGVIAYNSLVPGAWPAGIVMTLNLVGSIEGAGGGGGNGLTTPSNGGNPGGVALDARGISGYTFQVNNTGGIYGGGGGGGGGGMDGTNTYGGGGGGGGQGNAGGPAGGGGAGNSSGFGGANGAPGGPGGPGGGGVGGGTGGVNYGGSGGAGGTWGQPGAASGSYPGGAAGNAVLGNANIVWLATGTRVGPIA
jgi:hypothetical protein